MKKLLLGIPILAILVSLIGCSVNVENMIRGAIEDALASLRADYTIEVTGEEGLNFTGRYVVVTATYDPEAWVAFNSTSYDVSGNVSQQYVVQNAISVGGMFQKQSAGNETLTVKLWRGDVGTGTLVDSATTTDPFGAVLVTAVRE